MKELVIKSICLLTGADWRKSFPERWDLSKVRVWNEYGGNDGFVKYYTSKHFYKRFVNGIVVSFYDDSFVVKKIVGLTNGGFCSIALNKEALLKPFKR
jgi:hypothetical protein